MYVRQAANALEVLEYFARRLAPASAGEIAEDLGWPRSSTFKIIATLAAKGYLYEPHERGGYYPSPRWLVLAEAVMQAEPLPAGVHRLVRAVMQETGETTAIGAPAGTSAIFADVIESAQPVRFSATVGNLVPIHATSMGRALLAQMPLDERERLYRKIDFRRFSATTPMDAATVEAELKSAIERGYHQSNADHTPDLAGVAMPLPYGGRRLSIVVVGPVSRCLDRRPELAAIVARHIAALPTTD